MKPKLCDQQNGGRLGKADDHVGNGFPYHDLVGSKGGHKQLIKRSLFALPGDRQGREHQRAHHRERADKAWDHAPARIEVRIVTRAWYNPNLDSRWSMIPRLVGTLTMMGTLMLTALSVAREREQGTFDQLLVTPFRPYEIMVGKAVPNMVIGLTQSTTILLIAQFW